MPKFCGKCGSKLDEKSNLCPKCDATEIAKQKEAEKPKNKIIKNNVQQNRPVNKSLPAKQMSEKQKKSAKKNEEQNSETDFLRLLNRLNNRKTAFAE